MVGRVAAGTGPCASAGRRRSSTAGGSVLPSSLASNLLEIVFFPSAEI